MSDQSTNATTTSNKPVYKRKKFWAALVLIASGVIAVVFDGLGSNGPSTIMQGLQSIWEVSANVATTQG